ncbi:hypothetical protein [Streptomyces phaeochromogenes]|uniref:hypothetical protein n=1 Tax=Streptomyces phaeochromogenes TaxID=1923 RepID=UPI00371F205C
MLAGPHRWMYDPGDTGTLLLAFCAAMAEAVREIIPESISNGSTVPPVWASTAGGLRVRRDFRAVRVAVDLRRLVREVRQLMGERGQLAATCPAPKTPFSES